MRATTIPVLIQNGTTAPPLHRLSLGELGYNEAWLQDLIARHPEVLPVAEIEPAFEQLVVAGREIACGHGYIDNLFLTGGGDIVVVETKLHANPQSRREVVAQTLDYVAALSAMNFEKFEAAVCAGQHEGRKPKSLYELVENEASALEECAFADAISANLARGRMLALVVGDGVRREAETLANVLQSHAGSHFTFALVELAIYRTETGDLFVVPSTLAKTLMIERAVVRLEPSTAQIVVEPVPIRAHQSAKTARSITEIEFDDIMNSRRPGLAENIHSFIAAVEPLGVYTELRASLNLKAEVGADRPINLGYIMKNGQLWTDATSWTFGAEQIRSYLEDLAAAIGGTVVQPKKSPFVAGASGSAPNIEDILPEHAAEWSKAIEDFLSKLRTDAALSE